MDGENDRQLGANTAGEGRILEAMEVDSQCFLGPQRHTDVELEEEEEDSTEKCRS